MAFIQSTDVYSWNEKILGKASFKAYRLYLYNNGRLLLERQDSEKQKGWANLCEIFPYIRVGSLENENKKEKASEQGLVLTYHTVIIPLETTTKTSINSVWREWEFAFSFEREIKEWIVAFAKVLSFGVQFDQVMQEYNEKKKNKELIKSSSIQSSTILENGHEDPALLWSTARGSCDDYAAIWSSFLDYCSAKIEGKFMNGNGYILSKCF